MQLKFTRKLKSLDGADFLIPEPWPFNTKWWSFKSNGPAVRYEIGLEVESGYIAWAYGGFPAGSNRDIDISRKRFVKKLQPNERAVADKGCRHSDSFDVCENNEFFVTFAKTMINLIKNAFPSFLERGLRVSVA